MFTTKNWDTAQEQAEKTGKPVWKSGDGYYAVADEMEFADHIDADDWTEVD